MEGISRRNFLKYSGMGLFAILNPLPSYSQNKRPSTATLSDIGEAAKELCDLVEQSPTDCAGIAKTFARESEAKAYALSSISSPHKCLVDICDDSRYEAWVETQDADRILHIDVTTLQPNMSRTFYKIDVPAGSFHVQQELSIARYPVEETNVTAQWVYDMLMPLIQRMKK